MVPQNRTANHIVAFIYEFGIHANMATAGRTGRHSRSSFLRACNNIVQDVVRLLDSDERNNDYIQPALIRLQSLSQNISRMSQRFPECTQLFQHVQSIIEDIKELKR